MLEKFNSYSEEKAKRLGYLIAGFIQNTLSEKEHDELDEWVSASTENQLLFEELTEEKNIEENLAFLQTLSPAKALAKIKKQRKPRHLYWAAAASIAALIAIALIFYTPGKPEKTGEPIANSSILPARQGATLIYGDGTSVSLQKSDNGLLKNEKGVSIYKEGEQITYITQQGLSQPGLNKLATGKGDQYAITLPDGTKVWLNAVSSLQYPTFFSGKERLVELDGEGYFEVTKNSQMPFKVKLTSGSVIEVLGTTFNVMSYPGDPEMRTTLLEGKIKIASEQSTLILKPGEQVIKELGSPMVLNTSPDVEQTIAWKNGNFVFKNASIDEIMRSLSRWYNIDIKFSSRPNFHFNAEIPRSEPIAKILHLLELTDKVHFKTENLTVYVLP